VAAAAATSGRASSTVAFETAEPLQARGQAAWQQAQSEWQHVPATHKQLLGLFGVSAEAAV
jgi:hypothetical protein